MIVDTSVWIDFFNGAANADTEWVAAAIPRQRLGLTELILSEILQGLRTDKEFHQVRQRLVEFEMFQSVGERLAVASALNYRLLKAKGHTIRSTIDCIIATFCLEEGHTLLHRDRDFDLFETYLGLRVIHPEGVLH